LIRHQCLTIKGLSSPCVYLAPLWTYGADNGVTSLTFWGHVTSSVTWPFDSRGSTSYPRSMVTMRLSGTVREIYV